MIEELQDKIKNAETIYFVCSGNIIRSSFAELYARHLGITNTKSYGTTYHNTRIHDRSASELKKFNIEPLLLEQFSPTHMTSIESFRPRDLHIVMTDKHRNDLLANGVDSERIVKLKEILNKKGDVADPYFEGNWDSAYHTIKEAVHHINDILS